MKNKERKKELIENGMYAKYGKDKYDLYKQNYDFNERDKKLEELYGDDKELLQELMECKKKQKQKIMKQYLYWTKIQKKQPIIPIFATFTYSDKKAKEISPENLKRRARRVLDALTEDYALNIDYGTENERMHYHALIYVNEALTLLYGMQPATEIHEEVKNKKLVEFINLEEAKNYEKNTGYLYFELVDTEDEKSNEKMAKYMAKLTLHALKVKQKYVSVKKGTQYQEYKKEYEKYWRLRNTGTVFEDWTKSLLFKNLFPNLNTREIEIETEYTKWFNEKYWTLTLKEHD